jgi:catechol 2,3-dioxygenase-like lactoylglutathione lyase family enzyme|tara:strand:- start:179 stop:607 length:429 start_codon:yes stop_codon:yes gene_type:complete
MVKIRHTGIVTKDLKKSLWFWKDQLNFKIKKRSNEKGKTIDSVLGYENVKVKTLKLEDKNKNLIELLFFLNPPKTKKNKILPYSIGITHISVTVNKLEKLYKKLTQKKVKFNSEPKISEDKKVLMTYCRTPEGCFLELVEEL